MSTKIQWTEKTWNPIAAFTKRDLWILGAVVSTVSLQGAHFVPKDTRGWFCVKCSPGCAHCYAEGINIRLGNGLTYAIKNLDFIEFRLVNLDAPLRWKKPCMVFVNSMTDLFLEQIPDEMIDQVFALMAMAPRHTFQVLTKRARRMNDYINGAGVVGAIHGRSWRVREAGHASDFEIGEDVNFALPLPNVWLGVSCEDQARANERIPFLLNTPATIRFLSCEPLLEAIDLYDALKVCWSISCAHGHRSWRELPATEVTWKMQALVSANWECKLHWVIAGGESGRAARPCNIDWILHLVNQCKAAGVACFVKQLGGNLSDHDLDLCARSSGKSMHDRKGGDPAEWPEHLRVREFPKVEVAA